MKGKVSLLRPEFVGSLQHVARRYDRHSRCAGKYQWILSRLVNDEWDSDENADVRAELRKDDWYAEVSRNINNALPFPICSASGETLRYWCELDERYKNMPDELQHLKDILSLDHFRVARHLANLEENEKKCNTPEHILAFAYAEKFTVKEMKRHFNGSESDGVHPYESAIGHFDSLLTSKFEWIRDDADRKEIVRHLSEARKIAERYH